MAEQTVGIKITALDATGAAFNTVTKGLGGIHSAATQVGAAMGIALSPLALAAYATAMVTYAKSVINGIDALNDLKDATGASIENISALEDVARRSGASLDTVGTSLVKLNQALKGAKPGSDTERAIKAIGLSVTELKALDPAEAFQRIAVGLSGFADDANKARLTQELFGKSLKEVAPLLKDLAEQGKLNATVTTAQAEEAEKFNKQMYALQKNVTDASRSLLSDMVPALNQVISVMRSGGLMKGLDELGNQMFDWEGNALRKNISNIEKDLNNLREQQSLISIDIFGKKGLIQADIDSKIELLKNAKDAYFKITPGNAGRGNVNPALVDARASTPDVFTGTNKPAGISADQKLVNDGLKLYNDLMADATGYSKTFTEDVTKLAAAYQRTGMTAAEYADALTAITSAQPKMVAAEKASTEAAKRNTHQIKTALTSLEQIEFETQLLGLNADQRAQATMERELERQGIVKGTQAYDAYIDKLREAMAIKSAKEAGIESTEALAAANKKAAEESSKYWEDALMRAFESGKGFFESLWDTIKNTLKTQVLKVLVTGTMSGLGLTGAASAGNALSGVSGGLSLASGASSLFSVGSQVLGGTMSAANAGGTLIANATATGIDGLLATNAAYGTAVAGAAPAAGTGIASTLGAIPGWGWALAGVAAAAAIFGQDPGGPKTESGYGYGLVSGSAGSSRVVDGATGPAAQYNIGVQDTWASIAKSFGLTSDLQVGSYTAADPQGESPTQVQVVAGLNGSTVYNRSSRLDGNIENVGRTEEELAAALQEESVRVLFAALKSSNLDAEYTAYLAGIGDGLEEMTTALDTVVVIKNFQTALESLPFENLRDISFDAARGLIDAAGGLDALSANLSGFYDGFYSDSEKAAQLTINATSAFAKLNLTMPTATEGLDAWYRATVEAAMAMDQSIPAVAQTTAGLLALSGSVTSLGSAAESVQKLIDGIHTSVEDSLWQMQYGMGTDKDKYSMWDVKAKGLDDQLYAATSIEEIARIAAEEIKAINSSWSLLDPTQQKSTYGQYEKRLETIDAFVTTAGADPASIKKADNEAFAKTVSDAVAIAVEKAMAASAAAQQAAADAQAAAAANPTPIEVKVTVDTSASVEVDISNNG